MQLAALKKKKKKAPLSRLWCQTKETTKGFSPNKVCSSVGKQSWFGQLPEKWPLGSVWVTKAFARCWEHGSHSRALRGAVPWWDSIPEVNTKQTMLTGGTQCPALPRAQAEGGSAFHQQLCSFHMLPCSLRTELLAGGGDPCWLQNQFPSYSAKAWACSFTLNGFKTVRFLSGPKCTCVS